MTVFDIETDGFLDKLTKIHVVSYKTPDMVEPVSMFDYDEMREFFLSQDTLIGHFIVGFDVPVFTLFAVLTLHKGLWGVFDRKTLGCYLLQEGRLEFRHVFQLSSKLLRSP